MYRSLARVLLAAGSVLAVTGGLALGVLAIIDPAPPLLKFALAWMLSLVGFLFFAIFTVAMRFADVAAPAAEVEPQEEPEPQAKPAPVPPPPPPAGVPDASTALQQMRTYVGLEMWDLALDKANDILRRFPGSPEAEAVARNINELRWKAEPKPPPPSPVPSAPSPKEGSRKLLQHVKTYMELAMWDLAREKALAVAKADPESPEAAEAGRLLVEIEKLSNPVEPRTILEP